jgi:hypothetical protein
LFFFYGDEMNGKTKKIGGTDLNAKCFLIVGDENDTSTWRFPVFDPTSAPKTRNLIASALYRADRLAPIQRAMLIGAAIGNGITVDPRILAQNVEIETQAAEPARPVIEEEETDPEIQEAIALADKRADEILRSLGLE